MGWIFARGPGIGYTNFVDSKGLVRMKLICDTRLWVAGCLL